MLCSKMAPTHSVTFASSMGYYCPSGQTSFIFVTCSFWLGPGYQESSHSPAGPYWNNWKMTNCHDTDILMHCLFMCVCITTFNKDKIVSFYSVLFLLKKALIVDDKNNKSIPQTRARSTYWLAYQRYISISLYVVRCALMWKINR